MGVAGVPGCPAGACLARQSPTTNTRNFDEEPVWTKPERDKLAVKPITWTDGRSPARELAGRRVRLFFEVRDAHLYSFRAIISSFAPAIPDRQPDSEDSTRTALQ